MRIDLGILVGFLFLIIILIIAVVEIIIAERRISMLENKLKSYERALKFKDNVLENCVVRLEKSNQKKKTQLRVKIVDGKIVGYMDR